MRASPVAEAAVAARELGPLERWYWIADQLAPLTVIGRVRVHGALPHTLLRTSLTALQVRHPLLRVAIEPDPTGSRPRFVPIIGRGIPLDHQVFGPRAARRPRWAEVVDDRVLNDRIDWRGGPLAKATVLTHQSESGDPGGDAHDLILSVSHVVSDGTTALSLVRQWLALAAHRRLRGADIQFARSPMPAAEALFPTEHTGRRGRDRARAKQTRDDRDLRALRPRRIDPETPVPPTERRSRLLHRSLPPEVLDALVRACRAHGVSVHGVLAAAMIAALAEDCGDTVGGHYSIGSPINFRAELDPPVTDVDMGSYVATVPTHVDYRPGRSLWAMAREVNNDLRARKQLGEHFSMIHGFTAAGPERLVDSEPFVRYLDERGPINYCLSNIGRFDFPDDIGPWRVEGAQFLASLSVTGAMVATVNSCHGHLFWNFTYVSDVLSHTRAVRIADGCVAKVTAAVPTSRGAHP
ncbi:phthiocerol/phthiodiolone dimycocerosyl transferase family protein [Nocardia terpenica]|uniref:phthiocerol/phthiodiolone dimycocerosyl transferase family protein n=1 Tax=Nocardia terpenica TaxID=455432 RepID=UPI001E3F1A59|nr:hypothetical protein [Nocardia terpenica]